MSVICRSLSGFFRGMPHFLKFDHAVESRIFMILYGSSFLGAQARTQHQLCVLSRNMEFYSFTTRSFGVEIVSFVCWGCGPLLGLGRPAHRV